MVYPEYETYKERFLEAQRLFHEALNEQERIFVMTQPNAIRYDTDKIQVSPDGSILDKYMIEMEESKVAEKIESRKRVLIEREKLLNLKEAELRKSWDIYDRIYVCRYLEGMRIGQIAKFLNYSKTQTYRFYRRIQEVVEKDGTK